MIPYDLDPTLHSEQLHPTVLEDGYSPMRHGVPGSAPRPFEHAYTDGDPMHPCIGEKSFF